MSTMLFSVNKQYCDLLAPLLKVTCWHMLFTANPNGHDHASIRKYMTRTNKLSLTIMHLERWNSASLNVRRAVNTKVLVLWIYLTYLWHSTIFSIGICAICQNLAMMEAWERAGANEWSSGQPSAARKTPNSWWIWPLSNGSVPNKNVSCVENISTISAQPKPVCLPSFQTSSRPYSISLVLLSLKFSHLTILFISQMTHRTGNMHHPRNRFNNQICELCQ